MMQSVQTMDKFVGTKLIKAMLMDKKTYCKYRGWDVPANEDPHEEGYLVEYLDSPGKIHPLHENYISWSPRSVFDRSYKRAGHWTFGQALEALKHGFRVSRAGWNGKNMYLYLVGPGRYPPTTETGHKIAKETPDGLVPYAPYIAMMTAQNYVVPWLASQTDMLGEDWCVLD